MRCASSESGVVRAAMAGAESRATNDGAAAMHSRAKSGSTRVTIVLSGEGGSCARYPGDTVRAVSDQCPEGAVRRFAPNANVVRAVRQPSPLDFRQERRNLLSEPDMKGRCPPYHPTFSAAPVSYTHLT